MREYAKVSETVEKTKCVKMTCDICKRQSAFPSSWSNATGYDVCDVDVKIEQGSHYPGDYETTTFFYDICPNCWWEKLGPFIKSFGCEAPQRKENR